MPDGSNITAPEQRFTPVATDIPVVADRLLALVAALDLLDEHEGAFNEQEKIRASLTGLAFVHARELASRLAS